MLQYIALIACFLFANKATSEEDHALVSIYAINAQTKKILLDKGGNKSLVPASCMKAITTAAALHILGPDMRFRTDLEYEGTIDEEGTLHGNIAIRGGGDPCLGSDRIPSSASWQQQIATWTAAIKQCGIKKIEGTVIGDASRWEKAMAVPSWNWEDIGNYYGAGASALSFHENAYTVTFQPGENQKDSANILKIDPPLSTFTLCNEVKTGPENSGDRVCIYGAEFSPIQWARGTVPVKVKEFSVQGAIPDPPAICADLLADRLANEGISIKRQSIAPQNRTVIHTTHSPPLKEIVYWTNQKSINLYAEHLLKKIGEAAFGEGSTEAGTKAVTAFWKSQGVNLEGFHMADGSGLSRQNCVTAKQFVAILFKMKQSELFPVFLRSLPEQSNRCRAKSGNMTRVHGSVGFSEDLIFAILINQSNDPNIKEKIQNLLISTSVQSE